MHTATMPRDSGPMSESNPSSPATSTPTSPSSSFGETESTEETQSTTSKSSVALTINNRQLCPRHPINYNETLLKKLHGKPQIRTFNNISIPLPATYTESEDSSEDEELNDNNLEKMDTIS